MNDEAKVITIIGVIALLIFGGFVLFATKGKGNGPTVTTGTKVDTSLLVHADSHQTNPKALVNIVEFGDYQCPSCGDAYPVIKQILKDYDGKVNFVFRNFPLTQHPNALPAAIAVEAAGKEGKYWEMHDKLYENQAAWSGVSDPKDTFIGYAKKLGIDENKFKADLDDKSLSDFIQKDLGDGNLIGINATPTFFVQGQKIVGVPNINELKSTIDAILATSK